MSTAVITPGIKQYRKYVADFAISNPGKAPITLGEFIEQKDKEKATDTIELSDKKIEALGTIGWIVSKYTPANGQWAGVEGNYMTNKKANVSGTSFNRLSRKNLLERKARLQSVLNAIDIALS